MNPAQRCVFFLTLTVSACGCRGPAISQRTNVPVTARPVAKEANEQQLLDTYNAFARNIHALDATVELKATAGTQYSGVIEQYHEVKAFLLASRPWNIRMIGQAPVVGTTVFDMASDGQDFEVSIPSKNRFIEGPIALERSSGKPIENLRPQHLVEALLWPEVHKEEPILFEEYNDETARYYVLTVLRGGYKTEILRKIWFDRSDLRVSRLEYFGPKGVLLSDVHYADWQPLASESSAGNLAQASSSVSEYPRTMHIDRPHDEYRLDMTLNKLAVNTSLAADRFKLAPPQGVEVVHVGDDKR